VLWKIKEVDAVGLVRRIRDDLYEETKNLSTEELIAVYHDRAAATRGNCLGSMQSGKNVYGAEHNLIRALPMGTISLRLPDSLHKQIRKLADAEGISINQFISAAAAEKLAALMTIEYLEECAKRGSRETESASLIGSLAGKIQVHADLLSTGPR